MNYSDVPIQNHVLRCERRVITSCVMLELLLTRHDARRHDTSAVSSPCAFTRIKSAQENPRERKTEKQFSYRIRIRIRIRNRFIAKE